MMFSVKLRRFTYPIRITPEILRKLVEGLR